MNNYIKMGLAMLAGFGLGAIAVDKLHAQARPPAYVISEIDVSNADAYAKEYVPLANKALASGLLRSMYAIYRLVCCRNAACGG